MGDGMSDDAILKSKLSTRIKEANDELDIAQRELMAVLGEIDTKDRADKTMISTVLRDVLDKVSAAKRKLGAALDD
jgi:hypothetical protein